MIEQSKNKNEKGNLLAITVDVEDWYHMPSVSGSSFSKYKNLDEFYDNWNGRFDYLSKPTEKVLKILDDYGVKATFFVVADIVNRYPGLVESIVDSGHEIACHGLQHSCNIDNTSKKPLISPDVFKKNTITAKEILEDVSGKKVIGYRAPNALIGGWMIDVLESIGFQYDSSVSVNSLYNKTDSSLKGVTSAPYFPMIGGLEPQESSRRIVEFPFSYLEAVVKIPTGGGPMLRFLGKTVINQGLKQSLKRGHTVFYFHPIDISNESFPSVGNKRPFYWAIKGNMVEKRIRSILKRYPLESLTTLGEIRRTFNDYEEKD